MSTLRIAALFMLVLSALILGCSESETITNPDPVVQPPTSLKLIDELVTALSEMDFEHYDRLLDDRFIFSFNYGGNSWDKFEDLISTDNMLSGEARLNANGDLTNAILNISVDQMLIREAWEPINPLHPLFGSVSGVQKSLYQTRVVLYHSGGTITMESNQTFYAVPTTTNGDTTWALIGQQDEANKSNEEMTWSNIKWLFR